MKSFLTVVASLSLVLSKIQVDPSTNEFVDEEGRTLIFHGVNVVPKLPPYLPSRDVFDPLNSLCGEDMQNLKDWGLNVVRLGVMWEGLQPTTSDYFNATYIDEIASIISELYTYGIYTIVDLHQDLLSPMYCGEGIPDWVFSYLTPINSSCTALADDAVKYSMLCKPFSDYNIDTDANGHANFTQCLQYEFGMFYVTADVGSMFQHFYESRDARVALEGYWTYVAKALKSLDGVLGYELLNEPWAGDLWHVDDLLEPGYTDLHYLQPMYESLHTAIRSVDESTIILYESVVMPDTNPLPDSPKLVYPVGFTFGPSGDNSEAAKQALSYHVYCCGSGMNVCDANGDPHPRKSAHCDTFDNNLTATRVDDYKRIGGGGFLTEFGACSNKKECTAELNRVTAACNTYKQSWAYWEFKYYNDITTISGAVESFYFANGTLQESKVKALSQAYPQKISGELVSFSFDQSVFEMAFRPTVKAQTEIHLGRLAWNYPRGFEVIVSHPRWIDRIDVKAHSPLITLTMNEKAFHQIVTIKVVSK